MQPTPTPFKTYLFRLSPLKISFFFSVFQFAIGMGFPVDLPKKILSFSMNFQFQYMEPRNVTLIKDFPEVSRSFRETIDRRSSYLALQNVMDGWVLKSEHIHSQSFILFSVVLVVYNKLPVFNDAKNSAEKSVHLYLCCPENLIKNVKESNYFPLSGKRLK